MKPTIVVVAVAVGVLLVTLGDAQAQMFGSQSRRGTTNARLGTSNTRLGTAASNTAEMAGTSLQGNERFLRNNRRAGDFVGSDVRERKGFVGTQQTGATPTQGPAVGRIVRPRAPVVAGALAAAAAARRAAPGYQPRLAVGFEVPQAAPDEFTATVARQLAAIPGLHPADQIEVSVADGIATLRGTVVSERDRSLIGALLLLEPGISSVRNDLKVTPPQERSGESLPSATPTPAHERSTTSSPAK